MKAKVLTQPKERVRRDSSRSYACSGITDEQKICSLTVNNAEKLKHIAAGNFVLIARADETSDQYIIYCTLEKNAKVTCF